MIGKDTSKKYAYFLRAISLIAIVSLYLFVSYRQHKINPDDKTVPTVKQLGDGVKMMWRADDFTGERWILVDILASGSRFLAAFVAMGLLSIILGVLMGCFKPFRELFAVPLTTAAFIPPTAAMPIFFILFGTELWMYVAVIVFGTLPILSRSIALGIDEIHKEFLYKAETLGASTCESIWNCVYKQVLPKIIDNTRLQVGLAVILLIAAELMCADAGFGYRIRIQYKLANMCIIFPYCAILAAFGFVFDFVFRKLNLFMCPWYFKLSIRANKKKRLMKALQAGEEVVL